MNFKPCRIEGCDRHARQGELCATHYSHEKYDIEPVVVDSSAHGECAVSHCSREANSRQDGAMCDPHYQMAYRGKDPEQRRSRADSPKLDATCWLPDCDRRAATKKLCKPHYRAAKIGRIEVPDELGVVPNAPCVFDGCETPREAKGLCHTHYSQKREGKGVSAARAWGVYVNASPCSIDACVDVAVSRGLCANHVSKAGKYKLTRDELALLSAVTECENVGCSSNVDLYIDHDHGNGAVRGVLCRGCNSALGFARDDATRLAGLITYLASNRSNHPAPLAA